jgi:protein phosphatase PTC2/3
MTAYNCYCRLDASHTLVGLAMSRSIGDLAVKRVGVIADPVITQHEIDSTEDLFMLLASDGVFEFVSTQEAVDTAHAVLTAAAANTSYSSSTSASSSSDDAVSAACKAVMELANQRWSERVGIYRDDITCVLIRLPVAAHTAGSAEAQVSGATDSLSSSEDSS